jgi:DNA mismatch repair protein MutS
MEHKSEHTPLMQQYFDIKCEYPDTLLFFQVGDFYELFFEDAQTAAAYLGIALTARGKNKGEPIPLCGVPLHAKDHYLAKLIKGGFKVAICDQLEQPKPGTVVKRGVTQVLTPGTLTDENLLDEKSASYLFSFYPGEHEWALIFGELLTAQLWATIIPAQSDRILESELSRFFPDEVLVPNTKAAKPFSVHFKKLGYFTSIVETAPDQEQGEWVKNFNEQTQKQLQDHNALKLALYYFYAYVKKTQQTSLEQFNTIHMYRPDDFLYLDAATQRNLELIRNNQDGGRAHTLLSILDGATTPMGARMIKKWIQRPLIKQQAIEQRQDALACFIKNVSFAQIMQQLLSPIGDLERVVGRIALGRAQKYDYVALKFALRILNDIRAELHNKLDVVLLLVIYKHLDNFDALYSYLHQAIHDEPGDAIIKKGFDRQLDYMRELVQNASQKILALEQQEQQATGINSLKVRYNQVHGYYIEITNANKDSVPGRYIRQQTLVGKERFMTPELQQLQHEILNARSQIEQREQEVFFQVKNQVHTHLNALRKLAHALAHLDALHGLAKVAYNFGYVRPRFHESHDIMITQGRHPVIEQNSDTGFIPNNTQLTDHESLWIITGPNMGGKSTYLRQVALICIMAQCGSFVPAQAADLALLDRIFTRIGAGDNLAAGKSTFLVEMEETASICTQATNKSLVILDEVGRGTSTFDGLAIAQAVVEYLYQKVGARCLFATHYHELTKLSHFPGIVSYYAASKKTEAGIIFLYKMTKGVADGSFGVEVAKLANLPHEVIERAKQLLQELTQAHPGAFSGDDRLVAKYEQLLAENSAMREELARVKKDQKALQELRSIDFEDLSPRKAFDFLWSLRDSQ